MDSVGDAADVNNTPAETPCQKHGQNIHDSEVDRPYAGPANDGRPFNNLQDSSIQPMMNRFEILQLEFQDSQLSPALPLLPCLDKSNFLSNSSVFQETDLEFVPLRGIPDFSVIPERCSSISDEAVTVDSQLQTSIHDQATISEHPLEVPTALSEGENSSCSLSQHSLSHNDHSRGLGNQSSVLYSNEYKINRHMEGEEQTAAQRLSEGMHARPLLELREEDISVAVSNSSAISSPSEPGSNHQNTQKIQTSPSNLQADREQPQGGSLSLTSSFQKATVSTARSDVSNITFRDSQMDTHQTADHLHDQLLTASGSLSAPASRLHGGNKSSDSAQSFTIAGEDLIHVPGLQRALLSSGGRLIGADGSFLSSQPVFQSTPAVPPTRPLPALTKPSLIHSKQKAVASAATLPQSNQSRTGLMPLLDLSDQHSSSMYSQTTSSKPPKTEQTVSHAHSVSNEHISPAVLNPTAADTSRSDTQLFYSSTEKKDQVSHLALGRVQSLPSLSYLQKVDAWKANQSSSRSFCDNLALQGVDGVSLKKKAQDVGSDIFNQMDSRDKHQALCMNASSQSIQQLSSSHSGSVSPRRVDEAGASVCKGQASDSPVIRSQSHSSLSSVVTSIQRDTGTLSKQAPLTQSKDVPATNQSSLISGGSNEGMNTSAAHMDTNAIKMSPFLSLGRFSDVSSSVNLSSTLSSSQGSYHGEQSMRASVGAASSVVSLEVDNYAPYWTSRPTSPPHTREFNIEDRIPLYLLNLGIDQSPSTILNPFTRRGPIREPEFSPTDLCTIKGSIGTPTKSTQPSEVDSLQKETFSSSSQHSTESSASVSHHLSVHELSQPATDSSVKVILTQADAAQLQSTSHPSTTLQQSDAAESERSFSLPVPESGPREVVKADDDSLVGSGTLHEIRRLLGRAESLVSGRSSLTSSPGSHRLSESDTSLVSLGRNARGYHTDTSLSAGGNLSLLLTRSSSDSALKGSLSSSQGPQHIDLTTVKPAALSLSREESLKARDLRVTPRRAEPEGCSAADPDKGKPTTTTSGTQINLPSIAVSVPQNEEDTSEDAPIGSSENSLSHVSAEAESLSDSSSESSLAARVAKLLQSESPVSMVTSRPSTADPEDSRAREWILMKVSGRRCESLELNTEDRKRIEEIKRELLLNTKYTKWSSDSEGSAQSSIGLESQQTKGYVGLRNMENRLSDQLQKAPSNPLSTVQDLEAKVHEIALREGFSTKPFTSITISTTRRTPSPQSPPHSPVTGTLKITNVGSANETPAGTKDSDREKETEGQHIDEKKTTEDKQENTITDKAQRMSHIDYNVTSSTFNNKSHLSHIHVTLSPKPKNQIRFEKSTQNISQDVALQRPIVPSVADPQLEPMHRISTLNHVSSYEYRERVQGQNTGRVSARFPARHTQSSAPSNRLDMKSRTLSGQTAYGTAAVPTLLPYKPHGSSELFYMPQVDPELSPGRSDTTVESSHPDSDDAVPPHFNKDILGSREQEDNTITPKHKEGIYSKRTNMNKVSSGDCPPKSASTFVSTAPEVSKKNMETVGIDAEYNDKEDHFVPLNMEADNSMDHVHFHNSTTQEPKIPREPHYSSSQPNRRPYRGNKKGKDRTPHDVSLEITSSLDQLWRRFNEKWSTEESRSINDGETSLLDRLERLSRLIHNTTPTDHSVQQSSDSGNGEYDRMRNQEEEEQRERVQLKAPPKHAWVQDEGQGKVHLCPAERDESVETSSSVSTVDTERLQRAFGAHRVAREGMKSDGSLLRLYNSINAKKTSRRKPSTKDAAVSVTTDNTDDSTVSAGSLSSSSTSFHHSQRGVYSLKTKKSKVKLVSKSVQAGDLEIVINGTRKHTRDVGTVFPSPGAFKNVSSSNKFGSGLQNGIPIPTASTAKPIQTALKRDSSNKSVRTRYPHGVSWFVSADELKFDGRKENQPQNESEPSISQAWFEPYSRTRPWRESSREPLRERQNQQEQERQTETRTAMETDISDKTSALVRLSLQEALELHRPEFVSRSRERMKRLGLLVEERRLQAIFNREREELFNFPAPSRPLRAAPVPRKRVVPRKEMVQRSREKYAKLPEVQKRREEEKRRAEYRSYRLTAQLFNKKVTNRVLGRRAPWQ
ncbi:centrosome-associated protein ALMS1 isoform X2 [Danio rerio]|uniref:ALMS1 centrosome and basal body-associated protein n=1 Tax=Danio rerio TaxID=7955 RepID=F1QF92_DANRE|nr:Alstrom syndrome protein 1 isoform X1 [Danio rerio]|eukprot:XP_690375.6 Alstrom syndrome protein 1 isoform X1 [Danio rerio]